jgi:hypothetical protein
MAENAIKNPAGGRNMAEAVKAAARPVPKPTPEG